MRLVHHGAMEKKKKGNLNLRTNTGLPSWVQVFYSFFFISGPNSAAVARVTIPVETPILPGKCGGCIASQATSELTGCGQKKAKGVV